MFPELSDIKRRRKILELTQKELADLAEVSQSLITKIEHGIICPSYSLVVKIFETLQSLENKVDKKAKDIMTHPIIFVNSDELLFDVIRIMQKHAFSQLPVLDSKNSCIGSISEQTILNLVTNSLDGKVDFESIAHKRVKEVIGDPFPVVPSNTPLQAISSLLQTAPAVLIMDGQEIAGILTRADMFKIFIH